MPENAGDTVQGASFALAVPYAGAGTVSGATAAYWDLVRFGAPDNTDEVELNSDPSNPKSYTFRNDTTSGADTSSSPFSAGGLSYTLDTLQFVGPKGYLRVGNPGGYETWLPKIVQNQDTPLGAPANGTSPAASDPFGGTGVVVYSQDQISNYAPTINTTANSINNSVDTVTTWTQGGATATYYDTDYKHIAVLSGQAKDATGVQANVSYQVVDNMSALIGNSISTIGGQAATVWTGADASTGAGSLLWSNFGFTQNLFGGWISNITNASIDLQGLTEAKLADHTVLAPASINLSVAPVGDAGKIAMRLAKLMHGASIVGGLINAALALCAEAVTGDQADAAKGDPDKLQKALSDMKDEMTALTALTAALQVASTVATLFLWVKQKEAQGEAASTISITGPEIRLSAGGTTVTIGSTGFKVNAGDPAAMSIALGRQLALGLSQAQWDLYAGAFLKMVQDPATAALGSAAMMQTVADQVANDEVLPAAPTITLNSLTNIRASAANITFGLPVI